MKKMVLPILLACLMVLLAGCESTTQEHIEDDIDNILAPSNYGKVVDTDVEKDITTAFICRDWLMSAAKLIIDNAGILKDCISNGVEIEDHAIDQAMLESAAYISDDSDDYDDYYGSSDEYEDEETDANMDEDGYYDYDMEDDEEDETGIEDEDNDTEESDGAYYDDSDSEDGYDYDYEDYMAPLLAPNLMPKSAKITADPEVLQIGGRSVASIRGDIETGPLAYYLFGEGRTLYGVLLSGADATGMGGEIVASVEPK